MKGKAKSLVVVLTLAGTILFNSCIGSFSLTNKLLDWNRSLGNKWVNELVFLVISPAYGVAGWIDVVILNTIEFWTGSNPVAMNVGDTETIEKAGNSYAITRTENGFIVVENNNAEKAIALNFDEQNKVWSISAMGEVRNVLQVIGDEEARVFLPNGKTQLIHNENAVDLLQIQQLLATK